MTDPDRITYRLTVYPISTELRWSGDISIPAYRRLSDFVSDSGTTFLVLAPATPARWENTSFREYQGVESVALLKRNIVATIPVAASSPPPSAHPIDRIPKVPFRALVHIPPLVVLGDLHIPRTIAWLDAVRTSHDEFLPMTNASIWYHKASAPLDTDLKLALINRQWIVGIEPKS